MVSHDPSESHDEPSASMHGASHTGDGHADGHGEHAEVLGPIDWRAWGAALLGVASGFLVAACLYVSSRPI